MASESFPGQPPRAKGQQCADESATESYMLWKRHFPESGWNDRRFESRRSEGAVELARALLAQIQLIFQARPRVGLVVPNLHFLELVMAVDRFDLIDGELLQ